MGLSHIHNEYPYGRYEQENQGYMTGLKSDSAQTIYFFHSQCVKVPLAVVDRLMHVDNYNCALKVSYKRAT